MLLVSRMKPSCTTGEGRYGSAPRTALLAGRIPHPGHILAFAAEEGAGARRPRVDFVAFPSEQLTIKEPAIGWSDVTSSFQMKVPGSFISVFLSGVPGCGSGSVRDRPMSESCAVQRLAPDARGNSTPGPASRRQGAGPPVTPSARPEAGMRTSGRACGNL